MATADPFARTESLDRAALDALVARFEARGRHPRFAQMLREYLDVMQVESSAAVLDLGCGTGLVARAIARRPAFAGRVTGIDRSAYLTAAAERLAGEDGVADRTAFHTGDAQCLDVGDATLDAVIAHTLISHVEDPLAVLSDAARVVKRGGLVAVFDGDYASLTFGHADVAAARAADETLVRALVTNPCVMRQMPRLLKAADLELVTSFSWVLAEAGHAQFWASAFDVYRRLLPASGAMTQDEADRWAAALRADSDAGVFFGSCNYYAYIARRA